jgi:hypothetical protein
MTPAQDPKQRKIQKDTKIIKNTKKYKMKIHQNLTLFKA